MDIRTQKQLDRQREQMQGRIDRQTDIQTNRKVDRHAKKEADWQLAILIDKWRPR
jgi:hypothetical protein